MALPWKVYLLHIIVSILYVFFLDIAYIALDRMFYR